MEDEIDIQVKISDDNMEAYICILEDPFVEYTYDVIITALNNKKVVYGIQEDVIHKIIDEKIYLKEVLVAKGIKPVFGQDGYFDVPYVLKFDNKPKILPDGSVDYNQFDNFNLVNEGDVLATYVHPTNGCNGSDVKGKVLYGKNGKSQLPLKGKGFKHDEDNDDVYIATTTGRLEYIENKSIDVCDQFDISSDVNHATGDVEFAGDIHIKGNVSSGMSVRATGQIIVDGYVEAAYLSAGKDIVLKNGMQGAGKGVVEAKGDISGKFFEMVSIRTTESVYANAVMNCNIVAGKNIIVSGKIGVLLGGTAYANENIEAMIFGNMVETKTSLTVGVGEHTLSDYNKVENDIKNAKSEFEKIEDVIKRLDEYLAKTHNEEFIERKMQLIRTKFAKNGELESLKKHREELMQIITKAYRSKVVVRKSIYPGVTININGFSLINKNENYNVSYIKRGDSIIVVPNV